MNGHDVYDVTMLLLTLVGAWTAGAWAGRLLYWLATRRCEDARLDRRLDELTAPRPDCRTGRHDWHDDDAGGAVCARCARCGAEVPF